MKKNLLRRVISLILVIIMSLSIIGCSNGKNSGNTSDSNTTANSINCHAVSDDVKVTKTDMYQKYYDKLMDYQEKYGEGSSTTNEWQYSYDTGLSFAKLVDFDNNGIEELVLAYYDADNSDEFNAAYITEVWTVVNGQLKLLTQCRSFCTHGGTESIVLAKYEGNYYLLSGGADYYIEATLYGYNANGTFGVFHEFKTFYEDYETSTIDGEEYSYEEGNNKYEEWTSDCTRYYMHPTDDEETDALKMCEETIDFFKAELGIETETDSEIERTTAKLSVSSSSRYELEDFLGEYVDYPEIDNPWILDLSYENGKLELYSGMYYATEGTSGTYYYESYSISGNQLTCICNDVEGAYGFVEEWMPEDNIHVFTLQDDGTIMLTGGLQYDYDGVWYPTNQENDSQIQTDNADYTEPFYGIWCYGSKSENDAENVADECRNQGLDAEVFVTTDWANLNSEKYYVVTIGVYSSENEAKSNLDNVQNVYPDAYVKYSGEYQGEY